MCVCVHLSYYLEHSNSTKLIISLEAEVNVKLLLEPPRAHTHTHDVVRCAAVVRLSTLKSLGVFNMSWVCYNKNTHTRN